MECFASNSTGDVPYLAAIGQGDSEEECVPGEPIAAIADHDEIISPLKKLGCKLARWVVGVPVRFFPGFR
jgi:hypothetical protein